MTFSIPYLILAIFIFCLYLIETKRLKVGTFSPKMAIWIAYIAMWIFIGLRGHIMSDFISYYPYFNEFPDLLHISNSELLNGFEPGFNLYTSFIKTIIPNYFAWVAINSLIDLAVLAWFFQKYSRSSILPLIFFIAFNGILMEFNLYRNMKAIDLFLLSVPYLQNRNFVKYLILNIIGISFHTSAALYIPLFFFVNKTLPKWLIWGSVIIANFIFILNISIIGSLINNLSIIQALESYDKLTRYTETGDEFKFSVGFIERLISFLIFVTLYQKGSTKNGINNILFNCFLIYYISFLIFYEVSVFVERIPILFIFSYWVLYPNVLDIKIKFRQPLKLFVAVLVLLKIATSYGIASKYENVIFSTPNYYERKILYENSLIK